MSRRISSEPICFLLLLLHLWWYEEKIFVIITDQIDYVYKTKAKNVCFQCNNFDSRLGQSRSRCPLFRLQPADIFASLLIYIIVGKMPELASLSSHMINPKRISLG